MPVTSKDGGAVQRDEFAVWRDEILAGIDKCLKLIEEEMVVQKQSFQGKVDVTLGEVKTDLKDLKNHSKGLPKDDDMGGLVKTRINHVQMLENLTLPGGGLNNTLDKSNGENVFNKHLLEGAGMVDKLESNVSGEVALNLFKSDVNDVKGGSDIIPRDRGIGKIEKDELNRAQFSVNVKMTKGSVKDKVNINIGGSSSNFNLQEEARKGSKVNVQVSGEMKKFIFNFVGYIGNSNWVNYMKDFSTHDITLDFPTIPDRNSYFENEAYKSLGRLFNNATNGPGGTVHKWKDKKATGMTAN